MKKHFTSLFCLAILSIATFTTSCDNNDDETTPEASEPYVQYETHVALKGEDNMRDLGGFVGENNKRILFHKLYRSGELSGLTTEDLANLEARGINQVIDLRTTPERNEHVDKIINGASINQLPLISDTGVANINTADILSGKASAHDYMLTLYIVDDLKVTNWKKIFDLLETGNTTLWHCTAGKDRAGMTTALVLSSLGVDRTAIINDFLASNTYLSVSNEQTIGYINMQMGAGAGELLRPMLGVEEDYINAFFKDIDAKYGSMDNFLKELGVDKEKMKKLYLEK